MCITKNHYVKIVESKKKKKTILSLIVIIFLTINHLQQFLMVTAQAGLVVIQGRRPPEDCGVGAGC